MTMLSKIVSLADWRVLSCTLVPLPGLKDPSPNTGRVLCWRKLLCPKPFPILCATHLQCPGSYRSYRSLDWSLGQLWKNSPASEPSSWWSTLQRQCPHLPSFIGLPTMNLNILPAIWLLLASRKSHSQTSDRECEVSDSRLKWKVISCSKWMSLPSQAAILPNSGS